MDGEKFVEVIEVPSGITASVQGNLVIAKGSRGETSKEIKARGISLSQKGNAIHVVARPPTRRMKAVLRTIRTHIENLLKGTEKGYTYKLAIVYSHFPMNLKVKDKAVEISNFAGEKKPRISKIIGSTKVDVKGKEIIVTGINKDDVGQTAGNLETSTRIIGKDRRIYQDGIYIVEKAAVGA